jgi:hypothetical protein
MKAVSKVSAQAGQSGVVDKTSVESTAQDDDFQAVKRCKRHISNNTSQTAKNSTKPLNHQTTSQNYSDNETTEAGNTLPEQETLRKPGRPPPIMMTSTTNLIRDESDLKYHVKGEYEFRNTQNGTCIITKEMADYSAMKSYLEKITLHYFTFSPNSEKPIEVVVCHLPPETLAENISSSLENLDFDVIKVRQIMATRITSNDKPMWNPSPYFLLP